MVNGTPFPMCIPGFHSLHFGLGGMSDMQNYVFYEKGNLDLNLSSSQNANAVCNAMRTNVGRCPVLGKTSLESDSDAWKADSESECCLESLALCWNLSNSVQWLANCWNLVGTLRRKNSLALFPLRHTLLDCRAPRQAFAVSDFEFSLWVLNGSSASPEQC